MGKMQICRASDDRSVRRNSAHCCKCDTFDPSSILERLLAFLRPKGTSTLVIPLFATDFRSCSRSVGEPSTQMTLNTFHLAGTFWGYKSFGRNRF